MGDKKMKCPQCSTNHKYKDGMACSMCGYHFALNPKEPPRFSDMMIKNAIGRISGGSTQYFTYNQLYAEIHRTIKKKGRKNRMVSSGCMTVFIGAWLLFFWLGTGRSTFLFLFAALVAGMVYFAFRPIKVAHDTIVKVIETYHGMHPIEKLVAGKQMQREAIDEFNKEIFQHAPEGILIVERDDIAEMLILNRFYFENKALVVSENKYPKPMFEAYRQFLDQHPDIPVVIIHDASTHGSGMRRRLMNDKQWHLEGKNVKDLGLLPQDVDRMKHPIWIPGTLSASGKSPKVADGKGKSSAANIEQGLVMPVDIAPPAAMMGSLGLATMMGAALLSEELLAAQREAAAGTGGTGGGYG
jgi:hypothetical protein